MSTLLEVRHLRVSFRGRGGDTPVVRDVSFHVERGETVALVGESGSGKTVTALSLLGLLPDTARVDGATSIRIDGTEVAGELRREVEGLRGGTVGMVFQDPLTALNPVRRIGDQLREVLRTHRTGGTDERATALRLLEEVGLPEPAAVLDTYPHQLSGGMRQRALIAMALAGEPTLLVADEPTSALDATLQLQILDLLAELGRARRLGILLITHDFGVVRRASERVVVFYAGETVEEGPTDRMLSDPIHPYTRSLLAALPDGGAPKERFRVLPSPPVDVEAIHEGCAFRDRCPLAEERCTVHPRLEKLADGRRVRCWVVGP